MKKLIVILALMIIPCSAFGLEMLNDNSMDNITGQSGVSIAFDDIQMFINIERMAWIDCDGYDMNALFIGSCSDGGGGAISINNFQLDTLVINAITRMSTDGNLFSAKCGKLDLQYDYVDATPLTTCQLGTATATKGMDNFVGTFMASAISIDATSALPALTEGMSLNASGGTSDSQVRVGGVLITLPTAEIHVGSLYLTPTFTAMGTAPAGTSNYNDGDDFGTIQIDGIDIAILGGWLEIAPH